MYPFDSLKILELRMQNKLINNTFLASWLSPQKPVVQKYAHKKRGKNNKKTFRNADKIPKHTLKKVTS